MTRDLPMSCSSKVITDAGIADEVGQHRRYQDAYVGESGQRAHKDTTLGTVDDIIGTTNIRNSSLRDNT